MKKITLLSSMIFAMLLVSFSGHAQVNLDCGDAFVDSGDVAADYTSGETITYTICPTSGNAGDVVFVDFSFFSTENNGNAACYDGLTIYDGADDTFPTINPLGGGTIWCWDRDDATPGGTGDLQGMILSSTDASGCLTFVFTSDGSVTREGWEAAVTCGPPPTCTPVEGTAVLGTTDCGAETFLIDVDVTSLGDATTVTISNDAGVASTDVTATGVVSVGPFASGENVSISLDHDTDSFCSASLGSILFTCPIGNDVCGTAEALTIPVGATCPGNTVTTTSSATESPNELTSCDTFANLGVWYSFTAPASGQMEFESGAGSPGIVIYEGACDALAEVAGTCLNNNSGSITGLTPGNPYFAMIWTDAAASNVEFCLYSLDCAAAEATTTVVDACGTGEFTIDVDVTNLGSSTTVTVANDAGVASTDVTATGVVNIGPFVNGTTVVITLVNDTDMSCDVNLPSVSFLCPPANDDCGTAQTVTQETDIADAASATPNPGTLEGATDSGLPTEACNGFTGNANDDVWYAFEALTETVNITYEIAFDGVAQLYSGTCGALTVIDCADSTFGTGPQEEIQATGLIVGEIYYTRIYQYGSGTTVGRTFDLKVWSPDTLGTEEFENENAFTYFPNPVKNELTLNAQKDIQNVSVYNMLGQEVLRTAPNATDSTINMETLSQGAYFVQVTIGNAIKTVRVIKQ